MTNGVAGMLRGDARQLKSLTAGMGKYQSVITSPPYWDLQDYACSSQIGWGQSQLEYLSDIRHVLEACAEATTDSATLWLVAGFIRRRHATVMLPSMIAAEAGRAGWTPREWVTWGKEKSLPYAKHGELRDVTEHAILFSKQQKHPFFVEELLDPVPTSTWWHRYPERYSPEGRRPTNLWTIPIPTQGSWKQAPKHACPFPHELTYRMLTLTTQPGDSVLDPFAGVGSVPALASAMGRKGLGIELNPAYVSRFPESLSAAEEWWRAKEDDLALRSEQKTIFYTTIMDLRLLKFARVLGQRVNALEPGSVRWIRADWLDGTPSDPHALKQATVEIYSDSEAVVERARELARRAPLSKFGIQPHIQSAANDAIKDGDLWYREGKFWNEPTAYSLPAGAAAHVISPLQPDDATIRRWSEGAS